MTLAYASINAIKLWFGACLLVFGLICVKNGNAYPDNLYIQSSPNERPDESERNQLIYQISMLINKLKNDDSLQRRVIENDDALNSGKMFKNLFKKRGERRCGQKLVQHLQALCNNCIQTPDMEQIIMKDKRSNLLHHFMSKQKRGALEKVTETCCHNSCPDEELRQFCCS